MTFIQIIKEKLRYFINNNKIDKTQIKVTDRTVELYNSSYIFTQDYLEFTNLNETISVHYHDIEAINSNADNVVLETVNLKHYTFTTPNELVVIEFLKEVLIARDTVITILELNDNLTDSQNNLPTIGNNIPLSLTSGKELQLRITLLVEGNKFEEAKKELELNKGGIPQSIVNFLIAYIYKNQAKFDNKPFLYYEAVDSLLKTNNTKDTFLYQNFINTYVTYQNNFTQIPVNRRKFILITDTFYNNLPKNNFLLLLKNLNTTNYTIDTSEVQLPKNIAFPIGHPVLNKVYVVHPYNDKFYIPVEEQEGYLFEDRINEFLTFAKALGASHVSYSNSQIQKVHKNNADSFNIGANVGYKAHGAGVNYTESTERNSTTNNEKSFKTYHAAQPTLKPYIPENLIWYPKETAWQRLYNDRLSGNDLLQISETIRSKSHKTVSKTEIEAINAELKVFFVSAQLNYQTDIKEQISEEEEMVEEIKVTFAPTKQLTKNYEPNKITSNKVIPYLNYLNKNKKEIDLKKIENSFNKQILLNSSVIEKYHSSLNFNDIMHSYKIWKDSKSNSKQIDLKKLNADLTNEVANLAYQINKEIQLIKSKIINCSLEKDKLLFEKHNLIKIDSKINLLISLDITNPLVNIIKTSIKSINIIFNTFFNNEIDFNYFLESLKLNLIKNTNDLNLKEPITRTAISTINHSYIKTQELDIYFNKYSNHIQKEIEIIYSIFKN